MTDGAVTTNGTGPRLATVRTAVATIDALEREETDLRAQARPLLGVTGRSERIPLSDALRAAGTSWYPTAALCALACGDAAAVTALTVVTPAIRASIGPGTLGSLAAFGPAFFAAGALAAIAITRRFPHRAAVGRAAALATAAGVGATALSTSSTATLTAALLIVVASGASAVVITPLLVDAHRPEVRFRVVALYAGAVMLGIGAANLVVVIAESLGLTWRSALMLLGLLPLGAAIVALPLRDQRPGRFDRDRVRRLVEHRLGGRGYEEGELAAAETDLTTAEQFRRLLAPRAALPLVLLAAAFGMFARALPPYVALVLQDRWAMVASQRAFVYGVLCVATLPGVAWFGRRTEIAFRQSPGRLVRLAAAAAIVTALALGAAAVLPAFGLAVVALAIGFSGFAMLLVASVGGLLTLTEPSRRGHAAAVLGLAIVLSGLVGQTALATIGARFGIGWALLTAAALTLAAGARLSRVAGVIDEDLDAVLGRMIQVDELSTRVSKGQHLPLLSCGHVDFSYGQVQVLFDVSFNVDDGEMVALLGTNGAGKSTLLRLISGLSFPSAGAIHYRGADITFLDTDRRVQLGIAQVPGGRAIFGAMTVVDNLRAFGHTLGRERGRLNEGIDAVFAAFPALADRRDQLAATLSGGEQQMLALGKAFILRPRLLLIDELSLGLAPKIVGELLGMVRRINADGTAVVLVEQSVNVALSLVDHAYFMEKGAMRFDGAAADLLDRPDLLRSVFLQGAAAGLRGDAVS